VRIVADYLLFEHMPINVYELESWLADEVRTVLNIYYANRSDSP